MAAALVRPGQPWHVGERQLQLQQKTVASSDEMGPHIYHKAIPESYQDMISPQPHFMASFLAEDGRVWPSAFFAAPGFAVPQQRGQRIALEASVDPRDGAQVHGAVKTGTLMGGVTIDLMSRRRNRFNGVMEVNKDGTNAMKIVQAFGNCPKYITRRRVVKMGQNCGGTGDAQEYQQLSADDAKMLQNTDMMYLGTGHKEFGADMNIRGGQKGFLRSLAEGRFLAWPDYVGNGFYMSLGNTKLNPQAGVLVVDWDDTGRALQILGSTETYERQEIQDGTVPEALVEGLKAMLEDEPQALRMVVVKVEIVRNIPQYCPHKYETVELSPYNPTPLRELKSGVKSHEFNARLQWAKPESEDVITFEFQLAPIPRPGSLVLKTGQHVRLGIPALSQEGQPPVERTWTVTSEPSWFHEHGRFQISVQHKKDGLVTPFLHQKLAMNKASESESCFIFHGFSGEFSPLLEPSGEYRTAAILPKHLVFIAGGIGVTPAIAALKGFIDQPGVEHVAPKTFTLFYSFRELKNAAFLGFLLNRVSSDLRAVAPDMKLKIVINITHKDADYMIDQLQNSVKGLRGLKEVQFLSGRLDSLKEHLPFTVPSHDDVEGFVCGPKAFEEAALKMWSSSNLPAAKLRTESFAY